MRHFNIFLSVIVVTRNQADNLGSALTALSNAITGVVSNYEIIVIDNASDDATIDQLKELTAINGLPNLQVFSLTSCLDKDTASWVGMENALGDFIVMIDPIHDNIELLPNLLIAATSNNDVVFAYNQEKPRQSFWYRIFHLFFKVFYKWLSGIDLSKEAPSFRMMSRRLVNFMLQHPYSRITYRHFPAASGFSKTTILYKSAFKNQSPKKTFKDGLERAILLLVSTSQAPMRLVTLLSLFGAELI